MTAGRRYFKGTLGRLLAAHIFEVHSIVLQFAEQLLGCHAERFALDHADDRRIEKLDHIQQ